MDIAQGEAAFIERVIALHPEADGKPAVIGNCQAGWALMIVAALRPDLFGPDHRRRRPAFLLGRRARQGADALFSGGLIGGSWLTALTGDLGAGRSTAPGWSTTSRA